MEPIIKIPISQQDIEWAKSRMTVFDQQKTYNKLECSNNYLGLLGEWIFHSWMDGFKIPHIWAEFIKQGWNEPDFIINYKSIDLKTTFDVQMWVQKPVFDYYVFARINKDDPTKLLLIGYIEGPKIQAWIDSGKINIVQREGRIDYVLAIPQLKPIENLFMDLFGTDDKYSPEIRKAEITKYAENWVQIS